MALSDKPRLFKKGDRVVVTYEVSEDQGCGTYGPYTYVRAQVEGITIEVLPTDQVLRLGTLTPAPEPKYVPKVGDIFQFAGSKGPVTSCWNSHYKCRCLYADDIRIVLEIVGRDAAGARLREHALSYNYQYRKVC